KSIKIGPPEHPATFMGPVIDCQARDRIIELIDQGTREAELVYHREVLGGGFYVGPAIFDQVPAMSVIATEEIFGPVISVLVAADFESALAMANQTRFGLTGGVYSRNPEHIDLAKEKLQVGNLYINRGITGALVRRQPFGGCKFSGVGAKAGGPDYVKQFMVNKIITENTMRRGFTPFEGD
ncbi:MAG: aldehyde dehydrogenase family protein, partial [Deltaproteobacteria bacterium]|nr:aldehyde dehydrogenase family protein [Deltaproteobacteria bacterium]